MGLEFKHQHLKLTLYLSYIGRINKTLKDLSVISFNKNYLGGTE